MRVSEDGPSIISPLSRAFPGGRQTIHVRILALTMVIVFSASIFGSSAIQTKPVNNRTLSGKLVMGYQGWFECPKDRKDGLWFHWFNGNLPSVDLLPDMNEYPADGRCPTRMFTAKGQNVELFSSQKLSVVETHFAWMETYGLDGVVLQRFAHPLLDPEQVAAMDVVLANVRRAAQEHGRVFYLMYDLSGMPPTRLAEVVKDWQRLEASGLANCPGYLHHRGRPLLGLWGLGFAHRDLTPGDALTLIDQLKAVSRAFGGVTIMGGVPADWRTGTGDAADDKGWKEVWQKLQVISPWTVGRYGNFGGADAYRLHKLEPDIAEAKRLHADYMPVVFPGFSWANMMISRHQDEAAKRNEIPRRCGQFYWRQVSNALSAGASMLYGAMFDEVDEGTAMFKVVPSAAQAPSKDWFLTLDADGCRVPSDWYLRLAREATKTIHQRLPVSSDFPLALPQ